MGGRVVGWADCARSIEIPFKQGSGPVLCCPIPISRCPVLSHPHLAVSRPGLAPAHLSSYIPNLSHLPQSHAIPQHPIPSCHPSRPQLSPPSHPTPPNPTQPHPAQPHPRPNQRTLTSIPETSKPASAIAACTAPSSVASVSTTHLVSSGSLRPSYAARIAGWDRSG